MLTLFSFKEEKYLFDLLHSVYREKTNDCEIFVINDNEIFDHVADVWFKRYRRFTREYVSHYLKTRPCTLLECFFCRKQNVLRNFVGLIPKLSQQKCYHCQNNIIIPELVPLSQVIKEMYLNIHVEEFLEEELIALRECLHEVFININNRGPAAAYVLYKKRYPKLHAFKSKEVILSRLRKIWCKWMQE
jgi:hypothetical protein